MIREVAVNIIRVWKEFAQIPQFSCPVKQRKSRCGLPGAEYYDKCAGESSLYLFHLRTVKLSKHSRTIGKEYKNKQVPTTYTKLGENLRVESSGPSSSSRFTPRPKTPATLFSVSYLPNQNKLKTYEITKLVSAKLPPKPSNAVEVL